MSDQNSSFSVSDCAFSFVRLLNLSINGFYRVWFPSVDVAVLLVFSGIDRRGTVF
jgi:hypothetical protein